MRRIALLALPLFILTACDRGLPTAAEISDGVVTAALVMPDLAEPAKVNLATATTLQLVVPDLAFIPTLAQASNGGNTDVEDHTINIGCPIHFGDWDGDGEDDDLLLHFEVASLFPPDVYTSTAEYPIDVTVALHVEFAEEDDFDAGYLVQLVWNAPKGYRGGR